MKLACTLQSQLATGGVTLVAQRADSASGLRFSLSSNTPFDLLLPERSCFSALGFASSLTAITQASSQAEPRGACVGLTVGRWEAFKGYGKASRQATIGGQLAFCEYQTSQEPLTIRLTALPQAAFERLTDLVQCALLSETTLEVIALGEENGEWHYKENERWRLLPNGSAALNVTRRVLAQNETCFDLTLTMEVFS